EYDEEDDLYEYDNNRDRRRQRNNNTPSRIEKMTIIMAIVSAVLVGFIVILLLGRSMGLFGGSDSTEGSSSALSSDEITVGGDEGIQIPDVTGKTYAEAVSILHDDKGFKVVKAEDTANTAAKDTVVSISPKAGERAKSGATITVYVSNGTNATSQAAATASTTVETAKSEGQVKVPNLIGLSSEDAVITLVEAGLTAGSIVETSHEDTNLTGLICAQSIAFGTPVSEGTIINMELSTGPASVTYSYNASIDAPSEGENYTPGLSVKVTLVTSDGTTLLSTTTTDFPLQGTYKGITAPTGTITFVYTATTPTTTNPETGETTGGESREYTVTRAVTFTQEN
ncbi:MAG: PASTA domain-containing protein, partial [Butyrivibrio sp.]|nr:PASTA domain-containing protein [Butyrivibrio sp.]